MQIHRVIVGCLALLLFGCSTSDTPPKISFLGIAEGTQTTLSEDLTFQDRYPEGTKDLTAAVQFEHITEGSTVRAMWFSPDDRRPPFGARNLTVESGATLARFSIGHEEAFPAGPYMLQVFATTSMENDTTPLVGSGSIHFYVGMSDDDIAEYLEEYNTWVNRER